MSVSGDFTVEVDESLSSPMVELTVESARVSFCCRFPDAETLIELLESVQRIVAGDATAALRMGRARAGGLSLIKDDEGDRFYLWSRAGDTEVRFTLSGNDAQALVTCFKDVIDQLRS